MIFRAFQVVFLCNVDNGMLFFIFFLSWRGMLNTNFDIVCFVCHMFLTFLMVFRINGELRNSENEVEYYVGNHFSLRRSRGFRL